MRLRIKIDKETVERFPDYTGKVEELNGVLNPLTRAYCKDLCHDKVGCCLADFYLLTIPYEFQGLQMDEADEKGWKPKGGRKNSCRYHTKEKGCYLDTTKPPICLGHVCDGVEAHIREIDKDLANKFIDSSEKLHNSCLYTVEDLERSLELMDDLITTGNKLLEKQSLTSTK